MNATPETQALISGQIVTTEQNPNAEKQEELMNEINRLKGQIKDKHQEIEETKTQIA